jgi:hypothetical protein
MTIKHPLFKKAIELLALQIAETLERNTFVNLLGGTQINYVNSRGARASLLAGDVMNPHEINRAYAMLVTLGAPRYMGDEITDMKLEADAGGARASNNPRKMPHYVAVCHPFVAGDLSENNTIVQAWTFSDLNRLYNYELGEWRGIRFCQTNLVPTFTGFANNAAGLAYAVVGGGTFGAGTYIVQVTGQDIQNQYESQIYQVSAGQVLLANQAIQVTLPTTAGFTYNVYVTPAGGSTPTNLGLSTSGPLQGPLTGQATQLAPGSVVVITGPGIFQIPPAAPATGSTVYPTFIFGRGAYAQVVLDNVKFTYLKEADKSDPLNQLRVVGWKNFYGTLIQNSQFFMRIESLSAFNTTFG